MLSLALLFGLSFDLVCMEAFLNRGDCAHLFGSINSLQASPVRDTYYEHSLVVSLLGVSLLYLEQ